MAECAFTSEELEKLITVLEEHVGCVRRALGKELWTELAICEHEDTSRLIEVLDEAYRRCLLKG